MAHLAIDARLAELEMVRFETTAFVFRSWLVWQTAQFAW